MPLPASAAPPVADRDRSIDALRGFALLGVVVVNAPVFAVPVDASPALATSADRIATWATLAFGAGKFFLIFSFLYGFGLSVALDRATRPGGSLAPLGRRLGALLALGAAHAALLFYGDILMLYALLGTALVLLRDAPTRRLAMLAGASLALAVCAQAGIIALALMETTSLATIGRVAGVGYLGGFADTVAARLADLPTALVFLLTFNGPAAFAMVLAGRLTARAGVFPPSPERLAAWRRRAPIALAVGGLASAGAAAALVASLVSPGTLGPAAVVAAAAVLGLAAPVLSFAFAVLVLGYARRRPDARLVRAFAIVGESSLSGYLLHSVLLGAAFLGWGLGLWGALDASAILAIALGTYAAIVALLALWRRAFAHGPMEIVLRAIVRARATPRARSS